LIYLESELAACRRNAGWFGYDDLAAQGPLPVGREIAMTVQPGWVPLGIDTAKANIAYVGVGVKPTFAPITRSEYGR
jgi:hypothetical protein